MHYSKQLIFHNTKFCCYNFLVIHIIFVNIHCYHLVHMLIRNILLIMFKYPYFHVSNYQAWLVATTVKPQLCIFCINILGSVKCIIGKFLCELKIMRYLYYYIVYYVCAYMYLLIV